MKYYKRHSFRDSFRVPHRSRKCVNQAERTESQQNIALKEPNNYWCRNKQLKIDGKLLELRSALILKRKPILNVENIFKKVLLTQFRVLLNELTPLWTATDEGENPTGKQYCGYK